MTNATQLLPSLAIMALVAGLVYMQRGLSALQDVDKMRRQQQQLNAQMRRFAEVTMKILGGADATAIAPEVAAAIADTTSFSRVMVSISNGGPGLDVAGHAGL